MKIKIASLVVALAFTGCDDDDDTDFEFPPDEDEDMDPGEPPPSVLAWNADIVGFDIYGDLNGVATVMQSAGAQAFAASIVVRNDDPGAVRPWHVHFGRCESGGGIVGADAAYPRLVIGGDGSATEMVRIDVPLDPAAEYHVNVHLSDAMLGTIIACGDLVQTQ